jgi:hypothetical protein
MMLLTLAKAYSWFCDKRQHLVLTLVIVINKIQSPSSSSMDVALLKVHLSKF